SLLGNNINTPLQVAALSDMPSKPTVSDSLVSYAMAHRFEIEMAKENEQKASLQYDIASAENHPTLGAFVSGGGKNGYVPDLYAFKANFVAGLSFKIPLFDGNIKKNKMILARTGIESSSYQTEITTRKISAEVVQANAACHSAAEKIDQYELQVKQAKEALKLANINYKAGTITNLALLDADNALSESQLMLLKARTDYAVSLSKLQAALGNLLY
ncbi:MAG TPA: TolC family protein, partial [Bacteroidales bacterium]|nr:TolC family protein [Bacteroidales bacterium]